MRKQHEKGRSFSPHLKLNLSPQKETAIYIFYVTQQSLIQEKYWYILKVQELKARKH